MSEQKDDGKLIEELVDLGVSLGKLTAKRAKEWAGEAREEVLQAVRQARQEVDLGLDPEVEQPEAVGPAPDEDV